jgi:hypothetical protein
LKRRMAETAKLNAKLKAYLEDPTEFLGLSRMNVRADGARLVAEFLPKWWVWALGCFAPPKAGKLRKMAF